MRNGSEFINQIEGIIAKLVAQGFECILFYLTDQGSY